MTTLTSAIIQRAAKEIARSLHDRLSAEKQKQIEDLVHEAASLKSEALSKEQQAINMILGR